MPSEVVQQPNGLFARFSSIVDNFTHFNCTDKEMLEILKGDGMSDGEAWAKIVRAKLNCEHQSHSVASEPLARWVGCLQDIRTIHGEKAAQEIIDAVSDKTSGADGT